MNHSDYPPPITEEGANHIAAIAKRGGGQSLCQPVAQCFI